MGLEREGCSDRSERLETIRFLLGIFNCREYRRTTLSRNKRTNKFICGIDIRM